MKTQNKYVLTNDIKIKGTKCNPFKTTHSDKV